jgi:RNA polymerase sigma factor (TIGR02999 family)
MTASNSSQVQGLLSAWRSGDEGARDQLFGLLYSELRQISAALIRAESNASLSTGDLVNEAVLRIVRMEQVDWADKAHFLALAARAMRRVLVDHARQKKADKRYHRKVTLITQLGGANADRIELDTLEKALIRLKIIDPDKAEIVELRYFGGLSLEEVALVQNSSSSTVKRSWRVARAWLLDSLNRSRQDDLGRV